MSKILEVTNALLDSANAVNSVISDYTKNEAQLATQNKQIQLQEDITNELNNIKRSSNYENWQQNMTEFFERVKNGMGDENSPYYCKNNLQAKMFTSILEQNRVGVNEKVNQLVYSAERDKAIADYNNNIVRIGNLYSGQDYINQADQLAKGLYDVGYITAQQYQNLKDDNYTKAFVNTATKLFDNTIDNAIKQGDDESTIIKMLWDTMPDLMGTDTDGLPKNFDTQSLKDQCNKIFKQNYRAKLTDMQQGNANKLSEINQRMRQARSEQERLNIARQGQMAMNGMTGNMLSEDDRNKYAAYFDYEIKGGSSGSGSGGSSAIKKLDPKDKVEFYMNAIRNGDETTINNAKKDFEKEMLEDFKMYTGNVDATIVDVEKAYPVVGQFLEYAKKNLPTGFEDVITTAENVLKTTLNTKGDNSKYKEELSTTMGLVEDILFDTRIKGAGPEEIKQVKNQVIRAINAQLGGILEKNKEYKDAFEDYAGIKTLSNYREGVFESKEERMAKAMVERDANPDLVYTKANGVVVPYALQEGLSRLEADERTELKSLIKSQTGKNVSDGEIKMTYEHDEGKDDVTAQRRYTIDGKDYRFSSKDGKHIILETKDNGKDNWHVIKTNSQQKEYDSPKASEDRIVNQFKEKNVTTIPKQGFTYTDENGKQQKLTYTDPEGEEKAISQTYWKYLREGEREKIIREFIQKNPDAAQQWLNSLPSKKK